MKYLNMLLINLFYFASLQIYRPQFLALLRHFSVWLVSALHDLIKDATPSIQPTVLWADSNELITTPNRNEQQRTLLLTYLLWWSSTVMVAVFPHSNRNSIIPLDPSWLRPRHALGRCQPFGSASFTWREVCQAFSSTREILDKR